MAFVTSEEIEMPEFLYPGVYVEEVEATANPIAGVPTSGESLKRPSYFSGRLLDATTFQSEQNYFREKLRLHNRRLHGYGIVSGLGVSISPPDDKDCSRIIVESGYAIDPRGEEIALPNGAMLELPAVDDEAFVTLRYWEHPCAESPTLEGDNPCFPCVEEVCVVGVRSDVPPSALAVARVIRLDNDWMVDPEFVAPRVG
jgi:hypothetical protein